MKIRLKMVGFPDLAVRLGGDETVVVFDGNTVDDLLRWLQETHADPAQIRLIDCAGHLDPDIVLFRSVRDPVPRNAPGLELSDGDRLTLVVVVAGG